MGEIVSRARMDSQMIKILSSMVLAGLGCGDASTLATAPAAPLEPQSFTVAFQANVQGDIEPCG